ncbi:hypothetical protein CANARDRAFT_200248 [[Candida] arabinofermentans NRRL YB-2248]|uniref:UNC-45/Cro1/She4 central domain-containing protein n=1 Tax=[Candida] arabinofermentans NRRL YB-2248 TaxID=983967 RepID=A0A1E4SZ51_9ASCO|nr:hypothetical protein CANARDRAFT_200248 [[Candida] arabinofermentans NRRL YB-2248]
MDLLNSLLSQLSTARSNIVFNEDISPVLSYVIELLSFEETSSLALFVIVTLQKHFEAELVSELSDVIDDFLLSCDSSSDRSKIIRTITALFPVQSDLCVELFTKNDLLIKIVTNEIVSILSSSIEIHRERAVVILSLFSAASLNEECRPLIADQYVSLILKVLKCEFNEKTSFLKCLSALVTIKVWSSVKKEVFEKEPDSLNVQYVTEILINGLVSTKTADDYQRAICIEGLAIMSLNVSVKKLLRNDDNFIGSLLENLKDTTENSSIYGTISILSNLTTYNEKLTKNQQSMKSLQDYASLKNVQTKGEPEKDSDEDVNDFVDYLLTTQPLMANITEVTKMKSYSTAKGIHQEIMKLMVNLSTSVPFRATLVNQGILNILLSYLINVSKGHITHKKDGIVVESPVEDSMTRFRAIKALSKIITTHDPSKLFNNSTVEMAAPILFIAEIIIEYDCLVNGSDSSNSPLHGVEINPQDCFDSLVALINITSAEPMELKDLVLGLTWSSLYGLILSDDVNIQRSVLELISNIALSPVCSAKFFNWDEKDKSKNENYGHFKTLVQLMGLKDLKSQLAVLNVFANCSEYELISTMLAKSELFVVHLIDLLRGQTDEEDIVVRCFYILLNMMNSPDKSLLVSIAHKQELQKLIITAVKLVNDMETKQMGIRVCIMLKSEQSYNEEK